MSQEIADGGHDGALAGRLNTIFRRVADILVNYAEDWEETGVRI